MAKFCGAVVAESLELADFGGPRTSTMSCARPWTTNKVRSLPKDLECHTQGGRQMDNPRVTQITFELVVGEENAFLDRRRI